MKKCLLLATGLLAFATITLSAPVSREKALKSAQEFLNSSSHAGGRRLTPAKTQLQLATPETEAYYAFNIGHNQGFVLVSGDDSTPAILGYTPQGTFDPTLMPDNLKAWLTSYEEQIAWLQANTKRSTQNAERSTADDQRSPIAPLINCHWNQTEPYNLLCPMAKDSTHCATGCTATAMAQVMFYYRMPKATTETLPAYTTGNLKANIEEKGITTIDWENMMPVYDGSQTATADTAVATLMSLCGQSIKVDYNKTTGGDPSEIAGALRRYFGFAPSTHFIQRDNYLLQQWEDIIYNELAENRPVLYGGNSTGGGHEFIVDGYDNDGYFHINWGWGGNCDGYYLLTVLNTNSNEGIGASSTSDGYSFNQDAVIGITPYDELPAASSLMTINNIGIHGDETTFSRQADGGFHPFVKASLFNLTGEQGTFNLGLLVIDSEGNIRETYPVRKMTIPANIGYPTLNFGDQSLKFKDLPDGTYTIAIGCAREDQAADTQADLAPCLGTINFAIRAHLAGNSLTLQMPTIDLTGTINAQETAAEGQPFDLDITMTNNGTNFSRDVYIRIDGKQKGGFRMEIGQGETATYTFNIPSATQGEKKVELAYQDNNYQYVSIATATITVLPPSTPEQPVEEEPQLSFTMNIKGLNDTGTLTKNRATVNLEITNNGKSTFSGLAGAMLLLGEGTSYSTLDYIINDVSIPSKETLTLTLNFKDLPDNANFILMSMYVYQGKANYGNDIFFNTHFDGTTEEEQEDEANLDISIQLASLNSQPSTSNAQIPTLNTPMAKGFITITNESEDLTYNDKLWIWLNGQQETVNVCILPGETQKVYYAFDGLEDLTTYTLEVNHVKRSAPQVELAETTLTFHTNFYDTPELPSQDYNQDGKVDHQDIAYLIEAIATSETGPRMFNIADIILVIQNIEETTNTTEE